VRFGDVLAEVRRMQLKAAAYDELCVVVEKYIETDYEIPVELEPGRVPTDILEDVRDELRARQVALLQRIEDVEELEIPNVIDQDFRID
jgi:hypothetical protein